MARRARDRRLSVKTLSLLRDDLVAHYDEVRRGGRAEALERYRERYPGYTPEWLGLTGADLWWVTPAMAELAHAAAPSLPEDITVSDVIPSPCGILVWDGGIGYTVPALEETPAGLETRTRVVTGACWAVSAERGLDVALLGQYETVPLGVATIAPVPGPSKLDQIAPAVRVLLTTWILAAQPTIGRTFAHSAELRRARMRGIDLPMSVTVATLREIARTGDTHQTDDDNDGRGAHYSTRFLVRGHWRQQACGPARRMRKPTWVAPYVKGPDGAPFNSTDLVKVWRR